MRATDIFQYRRFRRRPLPGPVVTNLGQAARLPPALTRKLRRRQLPGPSREGSIRDIRKWGRDLRCLQALSLALAVLLGSFSVSAAPDDEAARVIARVNDFRAAHGLAPVAADPILSKAAQLHAEAMAESGAFSHDGPDGDLTERLRRAGYAFATAAENIGGGAPTPEETAAAWEQSPPHARNLLVPAVRDAGVGHAKASGPGQPFTDYWCLILAEPAPP